MQSNLHPPTYQIRIRRIDAEGNQSETAHWVWDSSMFMQARIAECERENAKYRAENNKPGLAMVVLL